ncbi:MAG: ATP-binding cassette domain-containing protein [Anaerolineaceae bacterium]
MPEILKVQGLETQFHAHDGVVHVVNGVDFHLEGETLGLVGESGCGKSVTMMSILHLIPAPPGKFVTGQAFFQGRDLIPIPDEELHHIRGSQISIIFRDPMTYFNPVIPIGKQVAEPLEINLGGSKDER